MKPARRSSACMRLDRQRARQACESCRSTTWLRWPMNCRALFSHEWVSAKARQASREICSAPRQAARRSSSQHADRIVCRSRPAGRSPERPRPARRRRAPRAARRRTCRSGSGNTKTSAAARCAARSPSSSRPRNLASGNRRRSSASCGPCADDDLGAGQIERKKRFEVLLDRDPPDADEDRARQIEIDRAIRPEQIGVDAARPHAEILEAAPAELGHQRRRRHHRDGRGRVEAPQRRVDPGLAGSATRAEMYSGNRVV